ncbi:unnamed protein product [Rotaria magnacalcarata]|uniref:Uncharacterized protein n=1 Tax=Rotaria magnacalcarata TaxID=392030 RepID=A0A816PYY3_9BILA|nr:unnamed protein product [Rotaria magnacalcarata]
MRRDGKYGTNKTIRYCKECSRESSNNSSSGEVSMNKRNRWQLTELLKKYSQSPDNIKKIVLQRKYTFQQYNGYTWSPRRKTSPPRHTTFVDKPDFIYQPYVKFLKVNHDVFNFALFNVSQFLSDVNNLEQLLDIRSRDIPVTLIYFLDGSQHSFSIDWLNARRHANGGYVADYCMLCTGDYCPFGPKIRGQSASDSRLKEVLILTKPNQQRGQCGCCSRRNWVPALFFHEKSYKDVRSHIKIQRRESIRLTKIVIESRKL